MASSLTTNILRMAQKLEMWDHDPGGVTAAVTTPDGGTTERWFDMSKFGAFFAAAMSSALTGAGFTLLELVGASDAAGTDLAVIKTSGALVGDAVGDWACIEATAQELRQVGEAAGTNLRYIALRITVANAADEAVVAYIGSRPRAPTADLTPLTTIA